MITKFRTRSLVSAQRSPGRYHDTRSNIVAALAALSFAAFTLHAQAQQATDPTKAPAYSVEMTPLGKASTLGITQIPLEVVMSASPCCNRPYPAPALPLLLALALRLSAGERQPRFQRSHILRLAPSHHCHVHPWTSGLMRRLTPQDSSM
jgi:hypothetical protein